MNSDNWTPAQYRPPFGESFGEFHHSRDVLFTDGHRIYAGYLQTWTENEWPPSWRMLGPDGWEVENVTHWMYLPHLPGN